VFFAAYVRCWRDTGFGSLPNGDAVSVSGLAFQRAVAGGEAFGLLLLLVVFRGGANTAVYCLSL